METIQLMGTTIPSPTGTGTATTVDGSSYVMLHNSGTTLRETVVQTAQNGTSLSNIYTSGGERLIIKKNTDHVIFSAHAEVKLTPVNPNVL